MGREHPRRKRRGRREDHPGIDRERTVLHDPGDSTRPTGDPAQHPEVRALRRPGDRTRSRERARPVDEEEQRDAGAECEPGQGELEVPAVPDREMHRPTASVQRLDGGRRERILE